MISKKTIFVNQKTIEWEVEDNPSVLAAGYIITPNGEFLAIKDVDDHSDIYTSYLNALLNNDKYYDTITGSIELIENYHVAYAGLKPQDFRNPEIKNHGGILFLPKDILKCELRNLQSTLFLLKTNRSLFGGEKIPVECHFGMDPQPYFTSETIQILEENIRLKMMR